jgi:hypothetical protein
MGTENKMGKFRSLLEARNKNTKIKQHMTSPPGPPFSQ